MLWASQKRADHTYSSGFAEHSGGLSVPVKRILSTVLWAASVTLKLHSHVLDDYLFFLFYGCFFLTMSTTYLCPG